MTPIHSSPATWMQTHSGAIFDFASETPDVRVEDIAWHLAHMCRYNGATNRFYSVAEHCVLMANRARNTPAGTLPGETPAVAYVRRCHARRVALLALHHDDTEAYLADVTRPAKLFVSGYREFEAVLEQRVFTALGLDFTDEERAVVRDMDTRICFDERAALLGPPPQLWEGEGTVAPLGVKVYGWSPQKARDEWLRLHDILGGRGMR